MKKEDAAALYQVYEIALRALAEAEPILWDLSNDQERDRFFDAHSRVIADILSTLRAPLVIEYRELATEVPEGPPDTFLDLVDILVVEVLTPLQAQRIDDALFAECTVSWSKVSGIVGAVKQQLDLEVPDVPEGYYAQRVASLVAVNRLESQGNLEYMRFSEVRLP